MTTCRWDGRDRPRVIAARHGDDCVGEDCAGCVACPEPHCRVCRRAHADQTCAECLASSRDDLREIGRMCDSLPEEVEHRGVEGEAMMLLAPATDPEAWGHAEASVLAGRLPADWIEHGGGDMHPQTVLGTWEDVWREHLDAETTLRWTLGRSVDYLDRNLHIMAAEPLVPFEDFAGDVRRCRGHLEDVLHDGEQIDEGAPCMACETPLVRVWGAEEKSDGWMCPRCKRKSTEAQYRIAVMNHHRTQAEWLTDSECATLLTDTPNAKVLTAGTIRALATKGTISKRRDSGRTVYSVLDLLEHALTQEVAS